ncbi:hypothetical protein [Fervidobacterium sp.]
MKRFSILLVILVTFGLVFSAPKEQKSKEPDVTLQLSLYLSQNFGLNFSVGISANYEVVEGKSVKLPKPKKHPHDIEIKYPKGKKGVEVELVLDSGVIFKTENVTVKELGKNRYRFELVKSSGPSYLIILSGKDVLFAISALPTSTGKVMISYWYRK